MTAEERETVIQYDDAGDKARVFTCHRGLALRLMRAGFEPVRQEAKHGTWSFEVPKIWVSIRRPRRYNLTETERQVRRDRGKALRARQLGNECPVVAGNTVSAGS